MPLRLAASSPRTRLARAALLSASLGVSTACYTSHPLMGAPDPGATAVVTLNDQGRVALGAAVGPNADRVEGDVLSRSDTAFVLAVRSVAYVGGTSTTWTGESVTVPVAGVRGMTERRFSKTRTALLAGGLVAALVAFIVTRSILTDDGAIVDDPDGGPPPVGSHVPLRP